MSRIGRIFDVFSGRAEEARGSQHEVPETSRNRVMLWCDELFSNRTAPYGQGDYRTTFWEQIHQLLRYKHGKLQLSEVSPPPSTPAEDILPFLYQCSGADFLDFLEYVFRVDCYFHVSQPEQEVVLELNEILRAGDLPYFVTDFVRQEETGVLFGRPHTVIKTIEWPRVIMRESEVVHSEAIQPALSLLQRPEFRTANAEYLEALEDYRKGDFGDCLTKCGSALESVMKILCDQNGWPYNDRDTASSLVKVVLANTSLDSYFEQALMIVATLRNRLSKSHGAGTAARQVPRHVAKYTANSTAAAILLLCEESGYQ